MTTFAIFRLPHAQSCTLIEQTEGIPEQFRTCSELNGRKGFVIAPFQVDDTHPILLIRPDRVEVKPLQKPVFSDSNVIAVEDYHKEYAIDFENYHTQLEQEVFQKIVLARSATYQFSQPIAPWPLFWQACQLYPRLFIALVKLPDDTYWLTATPEILLEGINATWRTIALAGTMQLEGDQLNGEGENMRWSTKNIQEQQYVATYIAECLEQFSLSFKETGPRTVRAANLVHLRSDFTFTLQENTQVGDLLEALHPTPAVCGLPKQRATEFILSNEHTSRNYYSGFMGPLEMYLHPNSDRMIPETHLYVSLRCMHINNDLCQLYAGGGLLKDSCLEAEWQETEAKMQTIKTLLRV